MPDLCPDAGGSDSASAIDAPQYGADSAQDGRDEGPVADIPEAGAADQGADVAPDAASESSADAAGDAPADSARDASTDSGVVADAAPGADAATDGPCGTVYFADSFDSNAAGWTLDSTWSIAPTCASPPAPQKGNPDPAVDHTTAAAGGVAGAYVCGNNPTGATSPFRYATSPVVDVSAATTLKLGFYRWLNSDADGWMTSTVDVYDGSAWVNLYTNPSGAGNITADSAWTKVEYDVTAQKNAAFRVRFGYAVTDAGVYEMSCWNVDDVTLSSSQCP